MNRIDLSLLWARRGDAWDLLAATERHLLEARRIPMPIDIDRWLRSALGCLEGAREMMALATEAMHREAAKAAPVADGGKEGG